MQMSGNTMRRGIAGVLAAGVLGGLAATTVALPTASADADCTVSGLSNAIGTVGAQTGQWFAGHPDANKAVTEAGRVVTPRAPFETTSSLTSRNGLSCSVLRNRCVPCASSADRTWLPRISPGCTTQWLRSPPQAWPQDVARPRAGGVLAWGRSLPSQACVIPVITGAIRSASAAQDTVLVSGSAIPN